MEDNNEIRLQKYLAEAGIASRRKSEELITQGKIKVNGKVITELGTKINPNKDKIEYNDKIIKTEEKVYILLNKPIDYVKTAKDQFNRKTVLDLVKAKQRIFPVGRLDMYTTGALILTNDGEFANKLIHPRNNIPKTYNATIVGVITKEEVENLKNGVKLDDGYITKPAKCKILKIDSKKNISRIQITISEGKNRQIRRMCEAIDKKVIALHRCKIGNIEVKNLKIGEWRYLTKKEIQNLI